MKRASLFLLFVLAFILACGCKRSEEPIRTAGAELQEERTALLNDWRDRGYLAKLEGRHPVAKLWVTPKFMLLDYDQKTTMVEVAFAWAHKTPFDPARRDIPAGAMLELIHTKTGNRVGSYEPGRLTMD